MSTMKTKLAKNWFKYYTFVTSGVALTVPYLAHTYFIDKYKNIFCAHEYAKPVEIHPKIYLMFRRVLTDLKIKEQQLDLYQPFTFIGLDTCLIGSACFKTGVRIGIPPIYANSKVEDINAAKIYVCNELVDWTRPAARVLLNTLVLPEEAKKFAIAREIIASQSYDVIREYLAIPTFIYAANYSYCGLYTKLNLVGKSPALRVLVYGGCALTSGILWLFQDNWFAYWKEKKVNEKLANQGIEYVKGGFLFYDGILHRNMAMRAIMNDNWKDAFSDRGEQNSYRYIFKKTLISDRRNFFAAKLKEMTKERSVVENTIDDYVEPVLAS